MFELSMGNDGIERGFVWIHHKTNERGLANGKALILENNWKTNSYKLMELPFVCGYPLSEKLAVLEEGKGEMLTEKEFEDRYNNYLK